MKQYVGAMAWPVRQHRREVSFEQLSNSSMYGKSLIVARAQPGQ